MQIELQWQTSFRASSYHAAAMLLRSRELSDPRMGQALAKPALNLKRWLGGSHADAELFFDHLLPLSLDAQSRRELATTVTNKVVGRQDSAFLADSLSDLLETLENAYREVAPTIEQESRPQHESLESQWRLHSRGLMTGVARLTDEDFLVTRAQVIPVHPIVGGAGQPFLFYNAVLVEIVATDANTPLPEVLRLAWLLSTLNLELPRHSENLGRARLRLIGPLAMIPIVLAAAEPLSLARCDRSTLRQAVASWGPWPLETDRIVDELDEWWDVYSEARPPLSAALAALDLMLSRTYAAVSG